MCIRDRLFIDSADSLRLAAADQNAELIPIQPINLGIFRKQAHNPLGADPQNFVAKAAVV